VPALGRYELLRPLARGGMADVYLARRRVAGIEKRLVIKRLRRDRHRDPRFLDMFIREAQLSMSLVQQNIVPVFDFGRIGDHVFLAMEYIEGRDLGSSLARQRGRGLPPILAAYVAAECCAALDHAHRRRDPVTHRDVTPRNVLLSWEGEVKLADFGIAAVVGEAAGSFGTPGYMAPEQANGEPVDARADVYALGIVLWESLTGEHVRPSGDRLVTLAAARSGELPPIPESVPPALAAMIRRATERDPAARFPTARALAEELDTFLVAERAREAGQSPAKQLADWLTARWGDERETGETEDALGDAGAVVTFLDDGEDGIRGGEHTARSIAETAAEEPAAGPAAPAGPPAGAAGARTRSPTAQPVASKRAPTASGARTRAPTAQPVASKRAPTASGTRTKAPTAPPPAVAGEVSPARLLFPSDAYSLPDLGADEEADADADEAAAAAEAEAEADEGADEAEAADSPARRLLPSEPHEIVDDDEPQPAPRARPRTSAGAADADADADAKPAPAAPARRRWLLGAIALVAVAAILLYLATSSRRGGPPPAADAAIALATADAPPAPPDAEPSPPDALLLPSDAALPPPDAPTIRLDAAIIRAVPRVDAGTHAVQPAGPLRPIWINALPWAYFTVDGDPKQYETPALLKLPAGPHRVTFMNPQLGVSRTVTVTIPAEGEARHVEKMN
jgi:tRNA A-37 threonylcarbamoyl transferase component Bud32